MTRQTLARAVFAVAVIMVTGVRFERTYVALACSAALLAVVGFMGTRHNE